MKDLICGVRYLVDAHRPAQDAADFLMLPMTVFYNPDYGYNCTESTARILRDKRTQLYVTWLPLRYWGNWRAAA